LNEVVATAFKMAYTLLRDSNGVGGTPVRQTGFRNTWRRRNDEQLYDSSDVQQEDALAGRLEVSSSTSVGHLVTERSVLRWNEQDNRLPQSNDFIARVGGMCYYYYSILPISSCTNQLQSSIGD